MNDKQVYRTKGTNKKQKLKDNEERQWGENLSPAKKMKAVFRKAAFLFSLYVRFLDLSIQVNLRKSATMKVEPPT